MKEAQATATLIQIAQIFSLSTRLLTSRTGPGLLPEEPAAAGAVIYLTKGKSISGLSLSDRPGEQIKG